MFLVGTVWFWLLLAVFFIFEFLCVELWESAVAATVALLVFLGLHWFWGEPSVWTWLADNPDKVVMGVAGYFVAGCLWGFVKWFLFLKEKARDYQTARLGFLRSHDVPNSDLSTRVPENLREKWQEKLRYNSEIKRRPLASENKSRIITWMAYWPWSALWTLIPDPFLYMYNFCAERLEKMSAKVYANVGFDADQEEGPPKPVPDPADEL
jgi:hypothetical protein